MGMPHYDGDGTNFSEERRKMTENTPENTPRTEPVPPQPSDSIPGSGEAPATQPNSDRAAEPEQGVPADDQAADGRTEPDDARQDDAGQ